MQLIDTHSHIHDSQYDFDVDQVLANAKQAGVEAIVCVGTSLKSCYEAVEFCRKHSNCYFTLALHPHETTDKHLDELRHEFEELAQLAHDNKNNWQFIGIGECGLDYFYHDHETSAHTQQQLLRWHLDLAKKLKLPVVFHVRDAFADFWSIYDQYHTLGVIHSFSSDKTDMEEVLKHKKLYLGINGIVTFSKQKSQLEAFKNIPLNRLVLETDAPYLTPVPLRGKVNEPANVSLITAFMAELCNVSQGEIAKASTKNAKKLFGI